MRTKQIALSVFVIVTFVLYSLQQRHEADNIAIVAPKSNSSQSSSGTSSSGSSSSVSSGSSTPSSSTSFKDGTYTGSSEDAFYGNVQVQATISGGKITDVKFLDYPSDQDNSRVINSQATPILKQEAIQAQSANVDIVSGATDTSQAFVQSLSSALQKAQVG